MRAPEPDPNKASRAKTGARAKPRARAGPKANIKGPLLRPLCARCKLQRAARRVRLKEAVGATAAPGTPSVFDSAQLVAADSSLFAEDEPGDAQMEELLASAGIGGDVDASTLKQLRAVVGAHQKSVSKRLSSRKLGFKKSKG